MKINIECQCPFCGKVYEVEGVEGQDYIDWQNGKHAQDAFPYLSPEKRESIISQICPKCWDKMFAGEEDEDEEDTGSHFHLVYEDEDSFLTEVDADLSDEDFLEMINAL